ncbi:MAG TPA: M23 family metallopeptidase [Gemmatimonadaceae bacterium]|nr:M23 family metallopeptidase [Gemmatimonadaceae bacterium]
MRRALVGLVFWASLAHGQTDSAVAWGRRYTDLFWNDQLSTIFARFTPEMRAAMDSAKFWGVREQIRAQLGAKQYLITEAQSSRPPYTIYDQLIEVEKITQPIVVRWTLDSAGGVAGFFIRPSPVSEATSAFLDYKTKIDLRLPFNGEWLVLWGGRTLAQNRHASSPDQRFAYDFGVKDGTCEGRPVLAPAAGTIADVIDTVADSADLGNYVVIDHGNGEFSFLAHLRRGSVRVTRGQHVKPGDPVGQCGTHLHYHMQSTPSFLVGAGMPAQFQHYVADGKAVDRGEPTRGQIVRPAP